MSSVVQVVLGKNLRLATVNSTSFPDTISFAVTGSYNISQKQICNFSSGLQSPGNLQLSFNGCRLDADDNSMLFVNNSALPGGWMCDVPSIMYWVKKVNDGYDHNGDPINPRMAIKKLWLKNGNCPIVERLPLTATSSDGEHPSKATFNVKRYLNCLVHAMQ